MQLAHQLGRFYVDRVLIAEGALLDAKNESEVFYMLVKLMEPESNVSVLIKIIKLEGLKVADQHVAREVVFL